MVRAPDHRRSPRAVHEQSEEKRDVQEMVVAAMSEPLRCARCGRLVPLYIAQYPDGSTIEGGPGDWYCKRCVDLVESQ